ncbi:hypothetical protein C7445_10994 [Alicyclobacillus sacchari]|uniref:Uncharacterized protein n=1 Tax=Alicyclobacillus sacchari TaxID=392010 RepID=A0A4R8LKH9_9BACL|nr:hypothetical protein C7445_10994 [Alicyclobacillus sacchari]
MKTRPWIRPVPIEKGPSGAPLAHQKALPSVVLRQCAGLRSPTAYPSPLWTGTNGGKL